MQPGSNCSLLVAGGSGRQPDRRRGPGRQAACILLTPRESELSTPRCGLTFRRPHAQAVTETTKGQRVVCGPPRLPARRSPWPVQARLLRHRQSHFDRTRVSAMPSPRRNPSPSRSSCGRTTSVSARSTRTASSTGPPRRSSESSSSGSWRSTGRSSTPTGAPARPRPSRSPRSRARRVLGFLWRATAEHPPPRGDRLGDARRARDQPCPAHVRDPRDPRQRGPLLYERADRDAVAALDRRLSARVSSTIARRRRTGTSSPRRRTARVRSWPRSSTTTTGPERRPAGSSTSGGC